LLPQNTNYPKFLEKKIRQLNYHYRVLIYFMDGLETNK
jgi:hypothetical protein